MTSRSWLLYFGPSGLYGLMDEFLKSPEGAGHNSRGRKASVKSVTFLAMTSRSWLLYFGPSGLYGLGNKFLKSPEGAGHNSRGRKASAKV